MFRWWFSVYSELCTHITTWFQNISICPQRNACLPTPHLPATPGHTWVYFLFLWICLFWTFHINWVIQYVAFCDILLSASIMCSGSSMLKHGSLLYPSLLWNNLPLCGCVWNLFIYSSVDRHLNCFHFWLLWIMLLWTNMYNLYKCTNMHKVLCGLCFRWS